LKTKKSPDKQGILFCYSHNFTALIPMTPMTKQNMVRYLYFDWLCTTGRRSEAETYNREPPANAMVRAVIVSFV